MDLENFLLELGHGFCYEAKQKRILISDEYFFIDLVFYHRILKCHVLAEIKLNEVKHEHIGLLTTTNRKKIVRTIPGSEWGGSVNKYVLRGERGSEGEQMSQ